jgi:hypothetical protein
LTKLLAAEPSWATGGAGKALGGTEDSILITVRETVLRDW